MTQQERLLYLINRLLDEQPEYNIDIPKATESRKNLLRALFNVRMPKAADKEFLKVQDDYLQTELKEKGITDFDDLKPSAEDIYIWQGDITLLKCDAIVNAANSGMTGCYHPLHRCIDNCIHTFSGIELRLACDEIIQKQGHKEPTGKARITPAFNLPCKYILHTVGPVVYGELKKTDEDLLASCYNSCLELADSSGLSSLAFCCISTGEFHFPNERAAEIALNTVREYKRHTNSGIKIIFNVFKDVDYAIYKRLIGSYS